MSEKIYKAARERGRVHLISYASKSGNHGTVRFYFFQKESPSPDNLPPGMYTPNPHRKEAEELAVKAFTLMQRGMMSGSKDLMKEALANANKALELDPDCYNALQCKAATVSMFPKDDKSHLREALACTERALTQKKDNAPMWYNKAGILEQLGRSPEALRGVPTRHVPATPMGLRGRSLPRRGYWKRWTGTVRHSGSTPASPRQTRPMLMLSRQRPA